MFNSGSIFNSSSNPQQISNTQTIFPNNPIYNQMGIEYKLSRNSEGINPINPFELKNNYLKMVNIITRNDFEKLSQVNKVNIFPNQNYPIPTVS
jgi:hypothetical protein